MDDLMDSLSGVKFFLKIDYLFARVINHQATPPLQPVIFALMA